MPRPALFKFVGGPLDAERLQVPTGLDGGPAGEVYVELRLSPARMAVGDPTISPARFTGPWTNRDWVPAGGRGGVGLPLASRSDARLCGPHAAGA